jgi:hypothetical protein
MEMPLGPSSGKGKVDVVCFFIEHGADINVKGNIGRSPLLIGVQKAPLALAIEQGRSRNRALPH